MKMENEVMVSVYCLAYNHEKYIRDTIEGIINQKTNFRYELIIHDDASNDQTATIIKEYERKFPSIIKAIYQNENQYSKRVKIVYEYILPLMKGKYIAICEGDDYWIDVDKLQKQFDYMEGNPTCSFCFTNGYIENQLNGEKKEFIPYSKEDKEWFDEKKQDYTLHDFYKLSFIPTASFFFPRKLYINIWEMYAERCPAGDLRTRLYLTAQGYAHFINESTCIYRENVPGSITTKWKNKMTREEHFLRSSRIYDMIYNLNCITENEYFDGLIPLMSLFGVDALSHSRTLRQFINLKKGKYKVMYDSLSISKKIKIIIKNFLAF